MGTYVYHGHYKEWKALQKLKSPNDWERLEAGKYLVSIQSKKATKFWEKLIIELINGSTEHPEELVYFEEIELDAWVISFLNQIEPHGEEVIIRLLNHSNRSVNVCTLDLVFELKQSASKYSDEILSLYKKSKFTGYPSEFLYSLASIGSDRPDLHDEYIRFIKDGTQKEKRGALYGIELFIKSNHFNDYPKLNDLLHSISTEDKKKLITHLYNIDGFNYPKRATVLYPTLAVLLSSEDSYLIELSCDFLKVLPKEGFIEFDKNFSKSFAASSNQSKIDQLNLFPLVGPMTKIKMKEFILKIDSSGLSDIFVKNILKEDYEIQSIAIYLHSLNERKQLEFIKKLNWEYSNYFLRAIKDYINSKEDLSLFPKSEEKLNLTIPHHSLPRRTLPKKFLVNEVIHEIEKIQASNKPLNIQFGDDLISAFRAFNRKDKNRLLNHLSQTKFFTKNSYSPSYKNSLYWLGLNDYCFNTDKLNEHPTTREIMKIALNELKKIKGLKSLLENEIKNKRPPTYIKEALQACTLLNIQDPSVWKLAESSKDYEQLKKLIAFNSWWHSFGENNNSQSLVFEFLLWNQGFLNLLKLPNSKHEKDQLFNSTLQLIKENSNYAVEQHRLDAVSTLSNFLAKFGPSYSKKIKKLMLDLEGKPIQSICIGYFDKLSLFKRSDIERLKFNVNDKKVPFNVFIESAIALINLNVHEAEIQEAIFNGFPEWRSDFVLHYFHYIEDQVVYEDRLTPYFQRLLNDPKLEIRLVGVEFSKGNIHFQNPIEDVLIQALSWRISSPPPSYLSIGNNKDFDTLLGELSHKTSKVSQFIVKSIEDRNKWDIQSVQLLNSLIALKAERHKTIEWSKQHMFTKTPGGIDEYFQINIDQFTPPAYELIPFFIDVLKNEKEEFKIEYALERLSKFGPKAKPAIPVIQQIIKKAPLSNTADVAEDALSYIQDQ